MEKSDWPHDFWVDWLRPGYPYGPPLPKNFIRDSITGVPVFIGKTSILINPFENMKPPKRKVVAISGYFNPIHQGHLDLIDAAAKYGDVYVILNNEKQRELKGSCPFYDIETRVRLLNSLKNVAGVIISIDAAETVHQTLYWLRPNIFINSGDRQYPNPVEQRACNDIKCEMIHLNLPKRDSSSKLLEDAFHWHKKEMLQ